MSAAILLQEALVTKFAAVAQLTGIFHDAPARAPFPYVIVDCNDERDWSCKGREGREIALQLVVWDDQPSRLLAVEADIEQRLKPTPVGGGWHLSSLLLTGKRRTRDPGGAWSCTFEHRARLIAIDSEVTE